MPAGQPPRFVRMGEVEEHYLGRDVSDPDARTAAKERILRIIEEHRTCRLDDGAVLALAVVTLSRYKLQERGGRWLKLVSGLVMLGLAIVLTVRPAWLAG